MIEFLLARIAEDEERAQAAAQFGSEKWGTDAQCWQLGAETHIPMTLAESTHIAHYDPVRVLAECRVKRRLIDLHGVASNYGQQHNERTLRAMCSVYEDHPDYDNRWAVG